MNGYSFQSLRKSVRSMNHDVTQPWKLLGFVKWRKIDHDLNNSDLAIQSHKKELFTISSAQHNYMGFKNTGLPLDLL